MVFMPEKYTLSVCRGKGNLNHNNRVFIAENVNKDKINLDVILLKKDLKEIYNEVFSEALEEYNVRQKRKSRRISNYLEHIKKSQNHEKVFEEVVIMVGNKDHHPDDKTAEKILKETLKTFQKNNKNCIVFNAVIHFDEATPHLHIDYLNIKRENKKGLKIQISKSGAMREMGYGTTKAEADRWYDDNRNIISQMLSKNGIEIIKGNSQGVHGLNINEFRTIMRTNEREMEELPDIKYKEKTTMLGKKTGELIISKSDYEVINKKSKLAFVMAKNIELSKAEMKGEISELKTENNSLKAEKVTLANEVSKWQIAYNTVAKRLNNLSQSFRKLLNVIHDEVLDLNPAVAEIIKPYIANKGDDWAAKDILVDDAEATKHPDKESGLGIQDGVLGMGKAGKFKEEAGRDGTIAGPAKSLSKNELKEATANKTKVRFNHGNGHDQGMER
jgi:hypothetical protein